MFWVALRGPRSGGEAHIGAVTAHHTWNVDVETLVHTHVRLRIRQSHHQSGAVIEDIGIHNVAAVEVDSARGQVEVRVVEEAPFLYRPAEFGPSSLLLYRSNFTATLLLMP